MSPSLPTLSLVAFRWSHRAARCLIAGLLVLGAGMLGADAATAADTPPPAEVLTKLHQSNGREIAMGKLAQTNGQNKEVKAYGRTLAKDHAAADKKVLAFAKKEKIELPTMTDMKADGMDMGTGAAFDAKFAQEMLDDHKKDIAEVMSVRDSTTSDKLKVLLNELLPTLEKHRDTAQKLVDGQKK
jgi:putative membrane protein